MQGIERLLTASKQSESLSKMPGKQFTVIVTTGPTVLTEAIRPQVSAQDCSLGQT